MPEKSHERCNRGNCRKKADIPTWQYVIFTFNGTLWIPKYNPGSAQTWLCRSCYDLVYSHYVEKCAKDKISDKKNSIIFGAEPTLEHFLDFEKAKWFKNTLYSEPQQPNINLFK